MKHNVGSLGRWCIRLSWIYLVAVVLYLPINIWALATHGAFGATLENAALGVPASVWLVAEWLGYGIAAAFVASMIASLFWIYRSSANARQIDPDVRRIGPTMAVVWWLIPIAQYWMPLGVMRQTWNSLHGVDVHARQPRFFNHWWACWVIGNVLGDISFRTMDTDAVTSLWLDVAATPLTLVAGFLWIRILRELTDRQVKANPMAEVFA